MTEITDKQNEVKKGLQDFIFLTKYARWDADKKRRETWGEAVDRVRDMHLQKYSFLAKEDKDEICNAFELVRQKRVLPSMRSMQFGGKAQLAHESRGFNCLGKHTKFITSHGVKDFTDFNDGDTVKVLSHNGIWRQAVVRSYGEQELYPITITKSKNSITIWATKNHRWFLKDGSVTDTLAEKMLLLGGYNSFGEFDYDDADVDERLYWAYGYVYGDGTKIKDKDGQYRASMVRLCGLEKQRFLHRFLELGFKSSEPLSCKGDAFCYTGSYLKTAPNPEIDDPRLIRAFVAGYLDADGAKDNNSDSPNKFLSIQSSELDHIEFIRRCFPIAGAYIISETNLTGQETNFGTRPYTISFRINTCPQRGVNSNCPFRVSSIGTSPKIDTVWCLEVEEDASFTLPNGLVTGNCSVRHVDSIRAFSEVAYLMLCGCGTGLGLGKKYLSRLPDLVDKNDKTGSVVTYVVEDTIEGWADSLEALLMCYFKNTSYSGRKITFDYSRIRRKGSLLRTGGGRAPGYKPLKAAHGRIKTLLDRIIEEDKVSTLRPIHAYDILMHFADAVLSGGVRRTASSVVFDYDDTEMMNAKTYFKVDKMRESVDEEAEQRHIRVWVHGHYYDVVLNLSDKYTYEQLKEQKTISWFYIQPQRARSNNSVLLIRDKATKEQFESIIEKTRQFGEPGFVWSNNEDTLYNPCFTKDTKVLTEDGWRQFKDILGTSQQIIQDNRVQGILENGIERWYIDTSLPNIGVTNTATNIRCTAENQDIFELELECGRKLKATANHDFATNNGMKKISNLSVDDSILIGLPPVYDGLDTNSPDWQLGLLAGFCLGDGNICDGAVNLDFWTSKHDIYDLPTFEKCAHDVISRNIDIIQSSTKQPSETPVFGLTNNAGSKAHKYRLSSAALFKIFEANDIKKTNTVWIHKKSKAFKSGLVAGLFYADGHIDYNTKSKSISFRFTQSDKDVLYDIMLILQELGIYANIKPLLKAGYRTLPDSNRCPAQYWAKDSYRLIVGSKFECEKLVKVMYMFPADKEVYDKITSISSNRKTYRIKHESRIKYITRAGKEDVFCLQEDNRRTLIAEGMTARRCYEIGFIPVTEHMECGVQFCNLTTINGNLVESMEDFIECIRATALIGTLQAGYTDFPYLSKTAKKLTEDEALLGMSITGILSNTELFLCGKTLKLGTNVAINVNREWAGKLGIKAASRITAIKPEGTGSLAIGVNEPGAHAAHAYEFFKRVQVTKGDPMYEFFKIYNPHMCEESVWSVNGTDDVVTFPMSVPRTTIIKDNIDALEHLKIIKDLQEYWVLPGGFNNQKDVTNNVSCTVIVKNEEWQDVIDYVYNNKQYFSAISFLDYSGDKDYPQAPFEKVLDKADWERYNMLLENYVPVDFTKLEERSDETTLVQEAACAGGACIV